jgi:predicted dehydrogenase
MIGLGAIGQRHVRNLRQLLGDRLELLAYRRRKLDVVLTDRMQVEAESGLEQKYAIQAFDDLAEAFAQKPEAAFICNPSSLHIPVAIQAARAGCHLFLEKPLSGSLDGIEELAAVLRQTGKLAYVGYQMRFHPCLRRVRELLNAGSIGSPLAVKVEVGEYLPAWHPYEDYRQSYAARSDLGGGTLLSQIHEMDYLYWFFGLPKRVFCLGGHLSSLEVDVEDVTSTLLEFEWQGKTLPVHLQQDFVQRPPVRTCVIVGDAGKLIMDLNSLLVTQLNARGEVVTQVSFDNFQRNQLFIDQTTHFLDCVEGRARPLVSLEDGISSLRMALAARQSLATGQIVEVGP